MDSNDARKLLDTVAAIYQDWIEIELVRIGLLRSNIIRQVKVTPDYKTMQVVVAIPDYYRFIESGRRPGAKQPPFDIILKWVLRKLGSKDANRRAWAICKAIAKRGIRARPFVDRAARNTLAEVADTVPAQLKVTVEKEVANMLYINGR